MSNQETMFQLFEEYHKIVPLSNPSLNVGKVGNFNYRINQEKEKEVFPQVTL